MMNIKFDSLKGKIVSALNAKNVKCWSCVWNWTTVASWITLVDGFMNTPIQNELSWNFVVWGPSIPMIAIVCNNCGHVQYYALKALLPNENI